MFSIRKMKWKFIRFSSLYPYRTVENMFHAQKYSKVYHAIYVLGWRTNEKKEKRKTENSSEKNELEEVWPVE